MYVYYIQRKEIKGEKNDNEMVEMTGGQYSTYNCEAEWGKRCNNW